MRRSLGTSEFVCTTARSPAQRYFAVVVRRCYARVFDTAGTDQGDDAVWQHRRPGNYRPAALPAMPDRSHATGRANALPTALFPFPRHILTMTTGPLRIRFAVTTTLWRSMGPVRSFTWCCLDSPYLVRWTWTPHPHPHGSLSICCRSVPPKNPLFLPLHPATPIQNP
jgi:hypothetical protein